MKKFTFLVIAILLLFSLRCHAATTTNFSVTHDTSIREPKPQFLDVVEIVFVETFNFFTDIAHSLMLGVICFLSGMLNKEMLTLSHKLKILYSIIILNTVNMMNYIIFIKKSAQMLFHDKSMLFNIISLIFTRMVRRINKNISQIISYLSNEIFWFMSFLKGARVRTTNTSCPLIPRYSSFKFLDCIDRMFFTFYPRSFSFISNRQPFSCFFRDLSIFIRRRYNFSPFSRNQMAFLKTSRMNHFSAFVPRNLPFVKFHVVLLFIIALTSYHSTNANASTFWIRTDGGNRTQCTGLADAAYDGSGSGEACAWKHPFWAFPPYGSVDVSPLVLGDTLIIKSGSYRMGYGSGENVSSCTNNGDCYMKPIPSGVKVYGEGWNTGCYASTDAFGRVIANPVVELWAGNRTRYVINIKDSDNVDLRCIEITDHADDIQCSGTHPNDIAYYTYTNLNGYDGINAIRTDGTYLKDLFIHGMPDYGIIGDGANWTLKNVRISGSGQTNFTGYATNLLTGTWTIDNAHVTYAGCVESYPKGAGYTYDLCGSQDQCGYSDGWGSDSKIAATFNVIDSYFAHNVHDGLDMLYNYGSKVTVKRSHFEGNGGDQFKCRPNYLWVENSKFISNCNYFIDSGKGCMISDGCGINFNGSCRSGTGGAILYTLYGSNPEVYLYNNTFWSEGNYLMNNEAAASCDGSEIIVAKNNIMYMAWNYANSYRTPYYYTGSGDCKSPTVTNGVVYGCSSGCPSGATIYTTTPGFNDSHDMNYGFNSDLYDVTINNSGSAYNAADETAPLTEDVDFSGTARGVAWDIGAYEYGTESATCNTNCSLCTEENCESSTFPCYLWSDNTCQSTEEPVCANTCSECSGQAACEASTASTTCSGHCCYWESDLSCTTTAETCSDYWGDCADEATCEAAGWKWWNADCHEGPEPACDTSCPECDDEAACNASTFPCDWVSSACQAEAGTTCNDGCSYCLDEITCEASTLGTCEWKRSTGVCGTETETCDEHCSRCLTEGTCNDSTFGCDWDAVLSECDTAQSGVQVPIAYDTVASGQTTTDSLSIPITIGNNENRMLLVGIVTEGDASTQYTISGVTLIEGSCALVDSQGFGTAGTYYSDYAYLYYCPNPTAGLNTVDITVSPTPWGLSAGIISLANVAQEAPEADAKASGTSTNATVALTTITNNAWIVDVVGNTISSNDMVVNSGQTERYETGTTAAARNNGSTELIATAGEQTISWTLAQSQPWGIVAAAVKPYITPVAGCDDVCSACTTSEECSLSEAGCYYWPTDECKDRPWRPGTGCSFSGVGI